MYGRVRHRFTCPEDRGLRGFRFDAEVVVELRPPRRRYVFGICMCVMARPEGTWSGRELFEGMKVVNPTAS